MAPPDRGLLHAIAIVVPDDVPVTIGPLREAVDATTVKFQSTKPPNHILEQILDQ